MPLLRRRGLAIGGGVVVVAAAAALALTGAAGLRGRTPADPPPATDIAARAGGATQMTAVPWTSVPPAVTAWIADHAAVPAAGSVTVGGTVWATLTSGPQPTAIRLFPLMLGQRPSGGASVEVALAPGAALAGGAHAALAVALPASVRGATFDLHVQDGAQGVALGPIAPGTCAAARGALSTAEGCAATLGLRGAQWSSAPSGTPRATLGGQAFLVKGAQTGARVVPASVSWTGPA